MSNPLIEDYLSWLMPQIRDEESSRSRRTFEGLCRLMFEKEFVELVPNDGNRIGDGLDLRLDFCRQRGIPTETRYEMGPCSFLEVLIGLSRRLAFNAGGDAPNWAWRLITNLQLDRMSDPIGRSRARRINDILDNCICRNYDSDGSGGFFPLAWPERDQRRLELWYQMHAYIYENVPEG